MSNYKKRTPPVGRGSFIRSSGLLALNFFRPDERGEGEIRIQPLLRQIDRDPPNPFDLVGLHDPLGDEAVRGRPSFPACPVDEAVDIEFRIPELLGQIPDRIRLAGVRRIDLLQKLDQVLPSFPDGDLRHLPVDWGLLFRFGRCLGLRLGLRLGLGFCLGLRLSLRLSLRLGFAGGLAGGLLDGLVGVDDSQFGCHGFAPQKMGVLPVRTPDRTIPSYTPGMVM